MCYGIHMNKTILACLVSLGALVALADINLVPVNDLKGSLSQNSIILTWTDRSTGEDRYELQVLKKFKGYSEVEATIPVPADATRYVFGPVTRHRDYIFRIRPANNLTSTAFSNVVTVKVK